jgi:NitT/TauT family transport system substrate-binding protein
MGLRLSALCLVASLLLAACGGASSTTGGGSAPAAPAPQPATAASAPAASGSGGSTGASGAAPGRATVAWVALGAAQAPAWMAAPYYRQNGVNVNTEFIQGSPIASAALVGGKVQFATIAGPAVVTADAKGAHEIVVMGFINQPEFVVVTLPSIAKPQQLAGATIAVSKIGSSDDFMFREGLSHWGLTAGGGPGQVHITAVSSIPAEIASLQKRLVQGVVVDPPADLQAEAVGGHLLARIADLGIDYQANALVTTESYAKTHPHVVLAVVKSFIDGLHRFKTDKAYAEQVMGHYMKTSNQKVLNAGWQELSAIFPEVPIPTLAGMQEIAREEEAAGVVKGSPDVSTMVDTSYVDQLRKDGFIQQVYSGGGAGSSASS